MKLFLSVFFVLLSFACQAQSKSHANYICAAACSDHKELPDNRFAGFAKALTGTEADLLAKRKVDHMYACRFGVENIGCQSINAYTPPSVCSAACTDVKRRADNRFLTHAKGRNKIEAMINAINQTNNHFRCRYGVAIVSCD